MQGSVSKAYKNCLKQTLTPILRHNDHRSKLHKREDFCLFSVCKLYYIMLHVCVKTNKKKNFVITLHMKESQTTTLICDFN
jgi:hypothetical protein